MNYNGKKLLILGASPAEITLVERARELGIYTIVTDRNLDRSISTAKNYADEVWDISWADLDILEEKCREEKIDGITAGYSEIRVDNLIQLCKRLDLPCYSTMEQLEITRHKAKFKDACRSSGVPVVNEYDGPENVTSFPVIIKPVDRGGSIGISIAHNDEELKKYYDYAMEMSLCKQVIIEDYITDAVKIDVYYAIMDGEPILLSSSDTINAEGNDGERVVQSAWFYPSKHHTAFTEKVDANMKQMIRDIGIRDGYIFFSGFVNEKEEFVFFETGFRLCGGHLYTYLPHKGMVNNLDLFISHALTGNTFEVSRGSDAVPQLKAVMLNLYSKKGTIKELSGFDKIKALPDCTFSHKMAYIGEECDEDKAILTKLAMFTFCNTDPAYLEDDVEKAYKLFSAKDASGNDLVYDRLNASLLKDWWN